LLRQAAGHGFAANAWAVGSRFIVSHSLLNDETYSDGLKEALGPFRPRALFILDEAHHAAPASGLAYAVDKPEPFRQHVFPHPPGAVGAIARNEAGADLCARLFIAAAALTAWSCQPGIEPASRDTERLAQPTRRPDPPVLRNETELHVDSFAK
jgi:hypothetical protein